MTTLFLFAHQDDEIGAFHVVSEAKRRDTRVACAFLTNGAWAGVTSETRNAESRKALAALGIELHEVTFLGTELDVPDGALVENLERSFAALCGLVDQLGTEGHRVTRIVMHAWEGGHQDHDAVHIVGIALAQHFGVLDSSRQFPLYRRSDNRKSTGFAAPLTSNGPVETTLIPLSQRLKHLRILTSYRSQARVILKLLPLIVRDYAVSGMQRLQPISVARLSQDPNTPPMLYETWKLYSYDRFRAAAQPFIDRRVTRPEPLTQLPGGAT